MTRAEAISEVVSKWGYYEQEFLVSNEEHEESRREMIETLRALGVTEAEYPFPKCP